MNETILHCDLNCFYASVEMLFNPHLRTVPMAVGGDVENRHGIILTKNALAKKAGVSTGEPLWQAKQKCPDLVIVSPRFKLYLKYSSKVMDIYRDYTDQIESFGIDEAWLDVSKSLKIHQSPLVIAKEIINRLYNELGLTVSIGISDNKIFSKLGSDLADVREIYRISRDNLEETIHPCLLKSFFLWDVKLLKNYMSWEFIRLMIWLNVATIISRFVLGNGVAFYIN